MDILFVCTGNTCRSPMAEGLMRYYSYKHNLDINAYSAGIFTFEGDISSNSIKALADLGIDISDYKSNPITNNMLESADLVLTMSNSHKDYLINQYPSFKDKVFLLKEYVYGLNEDISDPYGQNLDVYIKVRDEIHKSIKDLIKKEALV